MRKSCQYAAQQNRENQRVCYRDPPSVFTVEFFLLRLIIAPDKLYKSSNMGEQCMFLPVYDIKFSRGCRMRQRENQNLSAGIQVLDRFG